MIELNLVPDVKQEFIRAKRIRNVVISTVILVGIVSIGVVVLLALYLFGVQTVRSNLADSSIVEKSQELAGVDDLANTLTIQHQLSVVTQLHDDKNISSRFFDLLAAINPPAPNQVSFSVAKLDSDNQTIQLDGQAANGYIAADVLKKTILGTSLSYKDSNGKTETASLAENVSTSELSYGEDSTGKKVLRFTMSFEYDKAFFARSSENAIIVRPDRQDVTDSYLRLPASLFSDRANDTGEAN